MHGGALELALVFLLAAVVAVPVFKRFGLGAVLGYLVAGVLLGPHELKVVADPERVLAASLIFGYFLAPGFFLSLAGASLSLLTLGLVYRLPARWFGPVSLSVFAAFAHIGGQLLLARAWLIPHDGVFLLTPLFAAAALVFGTINGLIAAKLLAEHPEL